MVAALEPAFTPGRPPWPLAGMALAGLEPDDPDLAIPHGALQKGGREAPEQHFFTGRDNRFTHTATEPLGPVLARQAGLRRKWTLALAASCVLHVVVAAFFLFTPEEPVLMEGITSSGAASLGDAALDQTQAGDPNAENAVDVTMITVLDAVPVMVEAETVPTEEAAEQVEVAEAVTTERETVQPVEEPPLEAVQPAKAEPVKPVERIAESPAERETPADAEAAPAPTVSEIVPEVLATDRAELVDDDNFVQKPAPVQAEKPIEAAEAVEPVQTTETAKAEQAKTIATESPKSTQEKPVEADKAEAVEIAKAEPDSTSSPVETVKPLAEPEPRQTEKKSSPAKPVKQAEKKAVKPAAKPKKAEDGKKVAEKADAKAKKSGEAGRDQVSTQRGKADGREDGNNQQASRGGSKNGEIGNAAVSNYPGKVRSKLVRAARSVRAKGNGEVVVAFAVSANGGVRSARVARSSGVASVDQAALQAVRKAAPFPPIPAGAGKSTWEFSVPLAFRR